MGASLQPCVSPYILKQEEKQWAQRDCYSQVEVEALSSLLTNGLTKAKYDFVSSNQSCRIQEYLNREVGMEVLQFHACIEQALSCTQPR